MASAETVARYFLHLAGQGDEPVALTQMHLHKLLYYAQGWCLASRGRALFSEDIEAWRFGPVVPRVYATFKRFGKDAVPFDEGRADESLSVHERSMLEGVWRDMQGLTAAALSRQTHQEAPWMDAWGDRAEGDSSKEPITIEAMARFFGNQHRARCKELGIDPDALAASLRQLSLGKVVRENLAARRG
jgi:uncharacterized phage-associated protein